MENLYHRCKTNAPITFLFTTTAGHPVEVKAEDLPATSPYSPLYDPSTELAIMDQRNDFKLPREVVHYLHKSSTDGAADTTPTTPPPSNASQSTGQCSSSLASPTLVLVSQSTSPSGVTETIALGMGYNEYGELISAHSALHPPHSKDMTPLQILRIIKKGYHHNYRKKVGKVILLIMDGNSSIVVDDSSIGKNGKLSSWEFQPRSPKSVASASGTTPEETPASVAVYNGPPRVLEIGCGDGSWCLEVKAKYPDWIVEGVDDTDHWTCANKDMVFGDFMESDSSKPITDYFSAVHLSQENAEFTVRNINQLLKHTKPFLHNLYSLIRAQDVFDKIESYKVFLDGVRLLLEPGGVVEFLEVDPRPRVYKAGRSGADTKQDRTSGPKTDWTDDIADRFKNKDDEQLGTEIPGWMGRVIEDLKATLRPIDGVPGPQLKSWLEGAGFWDVKQHIVRLPVGGATKAGQLMKDYILFKHANEDEIPNLKAFLPKIEQEAIESGSYYLNLHIVTGRKPHHPRPGDLLLDGSRQEMTASKYEAMARKGDTKSTGNQWKRFDLDGELTGLVHGLSNLSGAPSVISPRQALTPSAERGKVSPLLTVDGAGEGKTEKVGADETKGTGKENENSEMVETIKEVGVDDDSDDKEVETVSHVEVVGFEPTA